MFYRMGYFLILDPDYYYYNLNTRNTVYEGRLLGSKGVILLLENKYIYQYLLTILEFNLEV